MSNSTDKQYRLLKDYSTPDLIAKAGEIGVLKYSYNYDESCKVWFDNGRYFFYLSQINMHPSWFEEVKLSTVPNEKIEVIVELIYSEHDKLVLKNHNGDTYTTRSEELMDFLASSKQSAPAPTTQEQERDYKLDNGTGTKTVYQNNEKCAPYNPITIQSTEPKTVTDKPVLFTTEDGKPIYEGDNIWWVCQDESESFGWDARILKNVNAGCFPLHRMNKGFSTKEAAEQYIKSHKKLFSLSEIKEYVGVYSSDYCLEKFELSANQKLKNQ